MPDRLPAVRPADMASFGNSQISTSASHAEPGRAGIAVPTEIRLDDLRVARTSPRLIVTAGNHGGLHTASIQVIVT